MCCHGVNVLHSPQNATGDEGTKGGKSEYLCCWLFTLKYFHQLVLGLSPQLIILEKTNSQNAVVFLFVSSKLQLQTPCGSVKARFCWTQCVPSHELWREYSFLSFTGTVSSGEKAGFQKRSPDICCIVEYGVSGTMLISCVNRKN